MKITYYGHSCFHFTLNGNHILVDPFISKNDLASGIDVDAIPADYIIITHGHQDHMDDAIRIIERTGARVISSFEIVDWFNGKGYEGHGMNTGGRHQFEFGTIRAVVAQHSSRLPDGSNGGNPLGFVISSQDSTFYLAGDTGLTMDMKLIPLMCPPLDFAVLPIGGNYTMEYTDVPLAAEFLECNTIIGCHFDTFDIIKIDHGEVMTFFNKHGIDGHLMSIGETKEI